MMMMMMMSEMIGHTCVHRSTSVRSSVDLELSVEGL